MSKINPYDVPLRHRYLGAISIVTHPEAMSSPRLIMVLQQLSQFVVLLNPEERRYQTGTDIRLAGLAFDKRVSFEHTILDVIHGNNSTDIIYREAKTGRVGCLIIPDYNCFTNGFGFPYIKENTIKKAENIAGTKTVMPPTRYARTPTQLEGGSWGFGVTASVINITKQEEAEDATTISESLANKMKFKRYFRFQLSWDPKREIPLNINGDDEHYKPLPEKGDKISKSGIIFGTRKFYNDSKEKRGEVNLNGVPNSDASKFTAKALQEADPDFDNLVYYKYGEGVVESVTVFKAPEKKPKEELNTFIEQIENLAEEDREYYRKIVFGYDAIKNKISKYEEGYTNYVLRAKGLALSNKKTNIKYNWKGKPKDNIIEIVISTTVIPRNGYKLTTLDGGKMIIKAVLPDKQMPKDKDGKTTDIVLYTSSTPKRLNLGRLKDSYVTSAIIKCENVIKRILTDDPYYASEDEVNRAFDHAYGLVKMFNTKQQEAWSKASTDDKREILSSIVNNVMVIYRHIDNKKKINTVLREIRNSIYRPTKSNVVFNFYGKENQPSDDKISIGSLYVILLDKTPDDWLAASTAHTNHFNVPASQTKADKEKYPGSRRAMKFFGESEIAAVLAYVGEEAVAESMDRSKNPEALGAIYKMQLSSESPSNIPNCVDRNTVPLGEDPMLKLIDHLYATHGVKFVYEKTDTDKLLKERRK